MFFFFNPSDLKQTHFITVPKNIFNSVGALLTGAMEEYH